MLYLGTTVLILFDLSYLSRFWTQFEAWLSMQFATPNGLKSAVGTKNARYHIVCIQGAAEQAEAHTKMLVDTWATKTPQQAFDFLSKPDVKVTNESDKHSQLPKIKALNKIVQDAFQAVDAQLQQRVAASAEAAARAKAELAAFERENGVKAAADDPLRKAAEQMEREAAAARAAQESHALAIAHGVMPNEEARVALEKDERANATLESGMKESLEQRLLATLHRDNGYWLEVAIEVPPAVFDASARDRAAVARLIKRLESDLIERKEDLRNRQHFPICITDAAHRDLDYDLEAGDVNILVWCGLGCDVAECAGSENAVNLKELKAKLSARKKPGLVVVCMKYGARQIAGKLKGVGAAIVWVEADVMSQNSNPERSSAPKKPLLAAVLAEVSSNLARSGSADSLIKEVEAAGGTAGMIVQGHESLPSQLEWKARPEAAFIVQRVSRLPDTRTNIFTNIFTSLSEEKLKLLASDISRTKELLWEIADAVNKDKCQLKQCISSKEIAATITDKEADKEAVKAARYRVRAVALTACNAFMHGGTFEAVYRIDSDDTKETLKETMDSLSQVSSALIWLDLEEEAEDDLLAEIHRLIKRFSRDGKKGVFLLTPTPTHLPKTSFDVFQLETTHAIGDGKQQEQLKASDFYQEITFIMPINILELLESHPKKVAEILNRILTDLFRKSHALPSVFSSSSPSSLAGLYLGNAEQTLVARFCVSSVGFLHQLRDRVLDGSLVKMLSTELGKALMEAKGAAREAKLPLGMIAAKMSEMLYNMFPSVNAQQETASSKSESEMTIAVDLSLFADVYESSILQLDQLTPHQEEKMGDALRLLRGDETHIVHLTAPAGAGKTFVAQQIVLDLLKDLSRSGIILFSARTVPLCLFFVKWLVKRCHGEVEDEQMIKTLVERVQVLHAPYEQGPLAVKLNEEKGEIEFVGVPEGGKAQAILLVVEDEAHHTYGDPELKLQVERQILRLPCQRLLLSDVSQSLGTDLEYPNDRKVVELTEVVRSSKRIITAANDFSLCGTKEKVPTCHHTSEGPPLQTFLFYMQQKDEPRRIELYAEQTIAALQSVVTQFERLPLHDRLAIIVPDEGMRARLQEKLNSRLAAAFPSRSFELVDAQRASRTYKKGVGSSSEWLVLDNIENMDGLERLIVIAVGLDSPIPENAEAAAEGDVLRTRSTLQTRSHLYRALTRAHMLVCVVNETLPRGWLAYLTRLKLSKDGAFDEASALAERTAAEESVENEKKRVTKCMEEAKAAVETMAKKHLLGKDAIEWCSAMAAKKLFAGGAAKAMAADAVCEWLIKPEMAAVEKMAAAQERGLEAPEARASIVRCVRSKLLELSARAPLKGGEGEGALAAVLAQWRCVGEELENALAAQEGLEGVGKTESMQMQVAVMAVVAEGGELKAAVSAEVQVAKRRREQMKEAAVQRARQEKLIAERKVKEEKLKTEVVQPAMAALMAGEAEELDKVACDWICADAVERMVAGAGGSEADGKMALQVAVAAWRQQMAVRHINSLDDIDNNDAVREASYQIQKEQSVWDTKANLSGVVGGVLAFDPTSLQADMAHLSLDDDSHDDNESDLTFRGLLASLSLNSPSASSLNVGDRVRRGPDWEWGDQDGGAGNAGTITDVDSDGWVRVKWDKGGSNKYRTENAGGTDLVKATVGEYVVSGAGGICASTINGTYSYTRQHNGAPLYTKEGGRAILYYGGGQYGWRMNDTDSTSGWYYSKEGSSGSVPCGQWTKDGYSSSDVLPCPTVARVGDDSAGGRPQVGATVLVLSASDSSTRSYVGQTGRLLEDDKTGRPFKVEFGDGNKWWFKEGELQKVGSLQQSAHRQTPWSGSVKCHGCGMYGPSPQTGPGGCAHCGLCGVCCAKPGRAQCTKAPSTLSPELTGVSTLCVGARVHVKRSVSNPTYGWGGVTHDKVGIVKRVDPDGDLKVDFPDHSGWTGKSSDMEVVTASTTVSTATQVRIRVQSGDRRANCSGTYNLIPGHLRNGGPCYTREGGTGAIYYDGTYWKICQAGIGSAENGWNFSQYGVCVAVPLGSWDASKRQMSETTRDYSSLTLAPDTVKVTQHQHILKFHRRDRGYICDVCRSSGGEHSYYCSDCDFDACHACASKFFPQPSAVATGSRLQVGQSVLVVGGAYRTGETGTLIEDDGDDDMPYKVEFSDSNTFWLHLVDVVPAAPAGGVSAVVGKVGMLSESDVRARLAIPASGFSFSSSGHLCFPSGPIWVASPSALADKAVTIRFRVTGNSSFDFGLVPRQKAGPDYLYQRGKYGINSTGTGGGVLRRFDCFNKPTELHVDSQARLLRVRVFTDESWSSVSIEEKQTIDDLKEWCIALGGFNGTKYQIFSWAENVMAPDGTALTKAECHAGLRVRTLDKTRWEAAYKAAGMGSLSFHDGSVGTVKTVNDSGNCMVLLDDQGSTLWLIPCGALTRCTATTPAASPISQLVDSARNFARQSTVQLGSWSAEKAAAERVAAERAESAKPGPAAELAFEPVAQLQRLPTAFSPLFKQWGWALPVARPAQPEWGAVRSQPLESWNAEERFAVPYVISEQMTQVVKSRVLALLPKGVLFNDFYPEVVISYASGRRSGQDCDGAGPGMYYAAGILKILHERGVRCFSGLHVPPGTDWEVFMLRLNSRRAQAKVLIVVLTVALFESKPCLKEINAAIKKGIPVLPIRFEDKVPGHKDQWARFTDEDSELMIYRVQEHLSKVNSIPHSGTVLTVPDSMNTIVDLVDKYLGIDRAHISPGMPGNHSLDDS